mmetsp:Transcript_149576/g.260978  ORF Transcript_149576/g.260978 Transcript_149576/m.260978 type:complete len:185 (+) Transcript_149576:123-677(+)
MIFSTIRVPPDPEFTAEVVILLTTLGAARKEYNAGKRARDLLEIKRVHHKIIDFNRDARQAGGGEPENAAIKKLTELDKLKTGADGDLVLPQIFIDGEYIGDATDLQGLEDDRQLDGILRRENCMACNHPRTRDSTQCPSCWVKFEEILPGMMSIEAVLEEIATREGEYDEDEYTDDEDEGFEG